jgi:hypothetical protein
MRTNATENSFFSCEGWITLGDDVKSRSESRTQPLSPSTGPGEPSKPRKTHCWRRAL